MVDHTSEALTAKVNYLNDCLREHQKRFSEDGGEILSIAQEVYVRDIIAQGMAQYSGEIVDYYDWYNAQEEAVEDEDYYEEEAFYNYSDDDEDNYI